MEVEVREDVPLGPRTMDSTVLMVNNTPMFPMSDPPTMVVRFEEVLLVVLVLIIWIAAIGLFFNRWGKIRMLEPYQPKFHQQPHRPSCPLAPLSPPGIISQQRMSFSKYNVNAMTDPLSILPSPIVRRPRQNSVFVGSSTMAILNPPRRAKSAMDIQHLIINEPSHSPSLTGSVIPILNRDRRPSITIDRPPRQRPSIAIERLMPSHKQRFRRSSCFIERPSRHHHRHFISFEHPSNERKPTMNIERPSCSYQQPIISFEPHIEAGELEPLVTMRVPTKCSTNLTKTSHSFEQPSKARPKPSRMSNSFDASPVIFHRRCSLPEEDRASPVLISMEETTLTAPLLEGLKTSDV